MKQQVLDSYATIRGDWAWVFLAWVAPGEVRRIGALHGALKKRAGGCTIFLDEGPHRPARD